MTISKDLEGTTMKLHLAGRLDTTTSPIFEAEINAIPSEIEALELDFSELEYLSSAGLRVILSAQKQMHKQGSMVVKNVNDTIMEVFDITGFADILTIE